MSRVSLLVLVVLVVAASPAVAQIDGSRFASDLRTKYGPPLARETFVIPAGEMVVDYAANGHVCRIKLPPVAPDHDNVSSPEAMDRFVLQLIPPEMRGAEKARMGQTTGVAGVWFTEYEHVSISHVFESKRPIAVYVTFAGENCQNASGN